MVIRAKSDKYKTCYLVTDEPLIVSAIEKVIRVRKESLKTVTHYGALECVYTRRNNEYRIWRKEDAPKGSKPCLLVIKER